MTKCLDTLFLSYLIILVKSLKSWDSLYDVCKSIFLIIHTSDHPLELGHVANIKKAHQNETLIDCPKDFLEVVHCDIDYGDTKSAGNGAHYCILFIDRATQYSWFYPLLLLNHESIKSSFVQWQLDAGGFPKYLNTDFDSKLLDGPSGQFLCEHNVILRGSPSGHQNQNGLIEHTWQTITNMAHTFVTDMQMPRTFWYWALHQATQVMNNIICTVEGISTTSHELVYGVKPDLWVLFRLFSTVFLTLLGWFY